MRHPSGDASHLPSRAEVQPQLEPQLRAATAPGSGRKRGPGLRALPRSWGRLQSAPAPRARRPPPGGRNNKMTGCSLRSARSPPPSRPGGRGIPGLSVAPAAPTPASRHRSPKVQLLRNSGEDEGGRERASAAAATALRRRRPLPGARYGAGELGVKGPGGGPRPPHPAHLQGGNPGSAGPGDSTLPGAGVGPLGRLSSPSTPRRWNSMEQPLGLCTPSFAMLRLCGAGRGCPLSKATAWAGSVRAHSAAAPATSG